MTDRLTPQSRSRLMSKIRSRDTLPEMEVRTTLHRLGYRYSLHVASLPGRPDLVFRRRNKVLFVHGCYWHGHRCHRGRAQSKSNIFYWRKKLAANIRRDRSVRQKLRHKGWDVLVVWECEIKDGTWLEKIIQRLDFL